MLPVLLTEDPLPQCRPSILRQTQRCRRPQRLVSASRPRCLLQTHLQVPLSLNTFQKFCLRFWYRKGFLANFLHELFNLIGLLFVLLFSFFLLFCIDWKSLRLGCSDWNEDCDIAQRLIKHPFKSFRWSFWWSLKITYIGLFLLYWIGTVGVAVSELKSAWEINRFCQMRLGISEEQMPWISWPELIHRLVLVQKTHRLCLHRDLDAGDIVNRILRKENYLVGMIDKGILQLTVPLPGFKKRPMMTKMMEWSLRWGLLTPMFDQDFRIKSDYRSNPEFISGRFRTLSMLHLLLAPFLSVFVVMYLLMMYVERFYHAPLTFIERSWSPYARWSLREFNEMEHQLESRLARSQRPAQDYVDQFPSYALMHIGKLLSFVLGSFVALLLFATLLQDGLLEADLMKHNVVWWAAVLMIGLKLARGMAPDNTTLDPDVCLKEVVRHTHFCPRLWRGHARSREVQRSFGNMFRYRPMNIIDEVLSIFMTPYLLYFSLPLCSSRIVQFLQNYTVSVEGVGDVCSLATFDFKKHGNKKYASSQDGLKSDRSKRGKMEKSFLTFVNSYSNWRPPESGRQMLENLDNFLIASIHPDATSSRAFPRNNQREASMYCSREASYRPSGSGSQSYRSARLEEGPSIDDQSTSIRYRESGGGDDPHQALERFYLSASQDDKHKA